MSLEEVYTKYTLHFEPGMHIFPPLYGQEVIDRFLAGDLSVHGWNPEVARRMRQYSPVLLGLDSAASYIENTATHAPSWFWLPGSPKQMSDRKAMYIVNGDLLHSNLAPPGDKDNPMLPRLKQLGYSTLGDYIEKAAQEATLTLAVGFLSMLTSIRIEKQMTRRSFLRSAALTIPKTVAAITVGSSIGRFSPVFQSYSTNPDFEKAFQAVTSIIQPKFSESTWLNGRTALVIAKTKEAMEVLKIPEGAHASVVMGYPHAYEAEVLMTDKTSRMEAIKAYAKEMVISIMPILEELDWVENDDDRRYVTDLTTTFFIQCDISLVKEPDKQQVRDPVVFTNKLLKKVVRFQSKEVAQAVSSIGDPYRYFLS